MTIIKIITLILWILAMVFTFTSLAIHAKIEEELEEQYKYLKNEYNTALIHVTEAERAAETYKKIINQQRQYIRQLEQYNEYITRK